MNTCEICNTHTTHLHTALGPDNDGEVRFVKVCCSCMEHEHCEETAA